MLNNVKNWLVKYRWHLIIWPSYIIYENLIIILLLHIYATFAVYATHYFIHIWFFYFHANILLTRTFRDKKSRAWKLPLFLIAEVAVFMVVTYADDYLLIFFHQMTLEKPLSPDYVYILKNLYRGVYFLCFSTGYYYLMTYNKERVKNAELEKQRLNEIILRQNAEQELINAQNAFLKAQINPHFLFNTLDFIYQDIKELSGTAAEAIIALSEMMRFAIDSDHAGETILLEEEIHQVSNFQYLNQLRKKEEVPFYFTYPAEITEMHFVPLVLLTLVENIFKHGKIGPEYPARLDIIIENDALVIKSKNSFNKTNGNAGSGTGLMNIEKRLNYAYDQEVTISYGPDDTGLFIVLIKVPYRLLHSRPMPVTTHA